VVSLEPKPLAMALNHEPGLAFAPPDHSGRLSMEEAAATPPELPSVKPRGADAESAGSGGRRIPGCGLCGRTLPTGRVVNFCPHCGGSQELTRCPACRSETEPGWRHCASCGVLIGGG
jgi:predicted RNA-binding Zn-ribbon protein involved in translation (DUF1610 family)